MTTLSTFELFPWLPEELKREVWRATAFANPRRVDIRCEDGPDPSDRSDYFRPWNAVPSPAEDLDNKTRTKKQQDFGWRSPIPVLFSVNQSSRSVARSIYRRIEIRREILSAKWKTYFVGPHDMVTMDTSTLQRLVQHYYWFDGDGDYERLDSDRRDVEDRRVHDMADAMCAGGRTRSDWDVLAEKAERRTLAASDLEGVGAEVKAFIAAEMRQERDPSHILRGDIGCLKRVVVYRECAEDVWPGLLDDDEFYKNMGRASQALRGCTKETRWTEREALLEKVGFVPGKNPPSTHMFLRWLIRSDPGVGVASTELDFKGWVHFLSRGDRCWPRIAFSRAEDVALSVRHDVVVWNLGEEPLVMSGGGGDEVIKVEYDWTEDGDAEGCGEAGPLADLEMVSRYIRVLHRGLDWRVSSAFDTEEDSSIDPAKMGDEVMMAAHIQQPISWYE